MMLNNKIIFLLTSTIKVANKPLSYSLIRSIYSTEERAEQTLHTIASIKAKCPNSSIILLESGKQNKYLSKLASEVDDYIYLGGNWLNILARDSKWKNLGEAVLLITAKKYFENKRYFFFKLSGRYFLNNNFNLHNWDFNKFNFLYKDGVYSTRLYGFPSHYLNYWYYSLLKSIPQLMLGRSLEYMLMKIIDKSRINYMNNLGVEGKIGTDGDYITE